jgi:hypothetical protein
MLMNKSIGIITRLLLNVYKEEQAKLVVVLGLDRDRSL